MKTKTLLFAFLSNKSKESNIFLFKNSVIKSEKFGKGFSTIFLLITNKTLPQLFAKFLAN